MAANFFNLVAFTKRVINTSANASSAFVRFALPCRCALCGQLAAAAICNGCERAYWRADCARCACCALPLAGAHAAIYHGAPLCGRCIAKPPAFDATFTLADYTAPLDTLARALKFNARLALARDFAHRLALLARRAFAANAWPDMVAPVPLSARRLAERGYNQAWEIARPFAHVLGLRAQPLFMARIVDTLPQSQLSARARQRNVRRAFTVSSAFAVRGLHIAVVDDVMTSGATLEQVARALKRAGAARITNLVALRTPKP